MRHRGRKSQAEREMEDFLRRQSVPVLTPSQPKPPPIPRDLADEEAALWEGVNQEFVLGAAAQMILRSALEEHAQARKARERLSEEGMVVPNRDGNPKLHPLVGVEQRYYRAYTEAMKLLRLKF